MPSRTLGLIDYSFEVADPETATACGNSDWGPTPPKQSALYSTANDAIARATAVRNHASVDRLPTLEPGGRTRLVESLGRLRKADSLAPIPRSSSTQAAPPTAAKTLGQTVPNRADPRSDILHHCFRKMLVASRSAAAPTGGNRRVSRQGRRRRPQASPSRRSPADRQPIVRPARPIGCEGAPRLTRITRVSNRSNRCERSPYRVLAGFGGRASHSCHRSGR